MEERQEQIHKKGFDIFGSEFSNQQILSAPPHLDYGKIKVGVKNLDDAVMDLGSYRKLFPNFPFGDKQAILRAIITEIILFCGRYLIFIIILAAFTKGLVITLLFYIDTTGMLFQRQFLVLLELKNC